MKKVVFMVVAAMLFVALSQDLGITWLERQNLQQYGLTSCTTNLVIAQKITTREMIPCGCPDRIPGWLVYHTKEFETSRLVEAKDDLSRGAIAMSYAGLMGTIKMAYSNDIPQIVPIVVFDGESNTVGFIDIKALHNSFLNRCQDKAGGWRIKAFHDSFLNRWQDKAGGWRIKITEVNDD